MRNWKQQNFSQIKKNSGIGWKKAKIFKLKNYINKSIRSYLLRNRSTIFL